MLGFERCMTNWTTENGIAWRRKYYEKHKDGPWYRNEDGSLKSKQYYEKNKEKLAEKRRIKRAAKVIFADCPICKNHRKMYYDHDHATGKFREYICHQCNIILGFAKDNTDVLMNCINYLIKHKGE